MFKNKIEQYSEKTIRLESELKVTNETVQRLVSELNSHEKELLVMKQNYGLLLIVVKIFIFKKYYLYDLFYFIQERDLAFNSKSTIENELKEYKERITTSRAEFELQLKEELERKSSNYEMNIQKLQTELLSHQNNYFALLNEIALVLTDDYVKVEPNLKEIKEKLQLLMSSSKSRGLVSETFTK